MPRLSMLGYQVKTWHWAVPAHRSWHPPTVRSCFTATVFSSVMSQAASLNMSHGPAVVSWVVVGVVGGRVVVVGGWVVVVVVVINVVVVVVIVVEVAGIAVV